MRGSVFTRWPSQSWLHTGLHSGSAQGQGSKPGTECMEAGRPAGMADVAEAGRASAAATARAATHRVRAARAGADQRGSPHTPAVIRTGFRLISGGSFVFHAVVHRNLRSALWRPRG